MHAVQHDLVREIASSGTYDMYFVALCRPMFGNVRPAVRPRVDERVVPGRYDQNTQTVLSFDFQPTGDP